MDFKILPDGDLEITCDEAEKADLQEILGRVTHLDHGFLAETLEYTGWQPNGHLYQVQPEWIAALTDAPILANDLIYPDDGNPWVPPKGKIWWFPNYQIESFAETLIRDGRVVFTAAPTFD